MTMPIELPKLLEPWRRSFESLLAPCVLLAPSRGTTSRTCTGGAPLLAQRSAWPAGPDGPLSFIGQVDFAEAAAAGGTAVGLPDRGLLALFYDTENYFRNDDPDTPRRFRVVYTPDAEGAVALAPPDDLDGAAQLSLVPTRGLSLPDFDDRSVESFHSLRESRTLDAYADFLIAFADAQRTPTCGDDHRLRGYASWLGEDGRAVAERVTGKTGWSPLWQIETTSLEGWDEVGMLHVLIRDEDLAARAFDRAWVVHQSS